MVMVSLHPPHYSDLLTDVQGAMWIYDHWDRRNNRWQMALIIGNVFLAVLGFYLMISGVSNSNDQSAQMSAG